MSQCSPGNLFEWFEVYLPRLRNEEQQQGSHSDVYTLQLHAVRERMFGVIDGRRPSEWMERRVQDMAAMERQRQENKVNTDTECCVHEFLRQPKSVILAAANPPQVRLSHL